MASHFYPSLVAFLDGFDGRIDPVEVGTAAVFRNPFPEEIKSINSMAKEWFSSRGLPSVTDRTIVFEATYDPPQHHDGAKWQLALMSDVDRFRTNLLSILRLGARGPVTTRLIVLPMADLPDCGYTLTTAGYVPPIRRPYYPIHYNGIDSRVEHYVSKYWGRDMAKELGVRWLNKSYDEPYEDDRIAHLVFGLEQLLLHGESEKVYLSYKMALRGAWLFGTDVDTREKIFRGLRDAYTLRSKIAHGSFSGSLSEPQRKLANQLEDTLRAAIIKNLDNPTLFKPEKLNRLTLGEPAG